MTRNGIVFRRRSPLEWGVRLVATVAIGLVGYVAVTHSLAEAFSRQTVEHAHHLAPGNGRIAADLSRKRLNADLRAAAEAGSALPPQVSSEDSANLARDALRRDPTAVEAAATLGLLADLRKDSQAARRWLGYAERLSRRDLPTQLWLIEDAVSREDIADALRHYDIALRTKPAASDVLYPVLASASSEPEIATQLVAVLARQPRWTESFIWFAAANTAAPERTAHLLRALQRRGVPISDAATAKLTGTLIAAGKYDAAWSYYSSARPGSSRQRARDPEFEATLEHRSPLDWQPSRDDLGISTSFQRGEEGGTFDFAAAPGLGGPLLQQVQLLPPGSYVLQGRSVGIEQPESSRPYWTLTCTGDGRELGRLVLGNSSQNGGRFAGHFTVPQGCPVQSLVLTARPSDELVGLTGQIERVELRPAD